jgi:hypothetical protein
MGDDEMRGRVIKFLDDLAREQRPLPEPQKQIAQPLADGGHHAQPSDRPATPVADEDDDGIDWIIGEEIE